MSRTFVTHSSVNTFATPPCDFLHSTLPVVLAVTLGFALSCAKSPMQEPTDEDQGNSGAVAACSDGIDNDGDGLTDYPEDPGCALALEDSESDDCPDGPMCPACANGIDDDGDGDADYPDDSGCKSASDNDELTTNPAACGTDVELKALDETGVAMGTVDPAGVSALKSNGCGGGGAEAAFSISITRPSSLVISTDFPETEFDTVVYLRENCSDSYSELACNDDGADAEGRASTLRLDRVEPGEYFVVVDGHSQGAGGTFRLEVNAYVGAGESCTENVDDCAPGLLCQDPMAGGAQTTCVPPRCSDGIDNDGDGAIDWPLEPGCATPEINEEVDDCPSGPNCASCSNGVDDDGDGMTDYGMDMGCGAAGDNVEEDCDGENDDIGRITSAQTTGTTAGATNDRTHSCGSSSGTAPDVVHLLDVPGRLLSLNISSTTPSWDHIFAIKAAECTAIDLDCSDFSEISLSDVDAGQYYVFVDGFSSAAGEYTLNVSGVIASGEACDPALDMFSCQDGLACASGVCTPAACNDGTDADGDGHPGYPTDPGCESPSDNDETDTCPGAGCPACSNGMDDDGDLVVDYPAEVGCTSAADDDEEDCPLTGVVEIMATPVTGTTVGEPNESTPSCSSSSTAPDLTHQLIIPGELESLTINTDASAFDTVLYLRANDCSSADLACNDDGGEGNRSLIEETDVPAGLYFITVDGYSGNSGAYDLSVTGVIKSGEACDAALEAGGVLTCATGTTCMSGTCQ